MNYRVLNIGMAISFAVIAMAILSVVFFDYNPRYEDPKEQVDFCLHYARYQEADSIAHAIAVKDPSAWDNQNYWIMVHFQIPEVCKYVVEPRYKRRPAKIKYIHRNDEWIISYFSQIKDSSYSFSLRETANIALASCYLQMHQLDSAEYYLSKVNNSNLPGCNANKGLCYLIREQADSAIYFFNQEIALNGYSQLAYRNLAAYYIQKNDQEKLYHLVKDPKVFSLLSTQQQEYIHFKRMDVVQYWISVVGNTFSHWNKFSFLGALLISFFWIFYLYKIDVYEPEKKRFIALCFFMGCLTIFPTVLLSDINRYWFEYSLNGVPGNDFMYSVLGIGMIEEFSKAIPFLIMLYFFRQVNEPYDYIKYACISALGFAFVENILYIDNYGIKVMHGRMTLSAFGHLFFSAIIGYTMAFNEYRLKFPMLLAFAVGLVLASFAHGFYDFWLINESVNGLALLSYVMIILAIFIFHGFINSTLNNSDFFDRNKKFDNVYYSTILIVGSSFVYAYEYVSSFLLYGYDYGLDNVYKMVSYSVCIYAAIFLVVINRVIIVPKRWLNIFHLFRLPVNRLDLELQKGSRCRFKKFTSNFYQDRIFPLSGEIVDITIEKERKYFLVRFSQPLSVDVGVKTHAVFRLKEKLDTGDDLIAFYLIPEEILLTSRRFAAKKMIFCGWAKMEIEDDVAL